MPSTTQASDSADVIQNKLNMLFASYERRLQSWLPSPTAEELAQQKTPEEIEKEEATTFRPMPTNLGIGAPLPAESAADGDGATTARTYTADDRLRMKLLGRRARTSATSTATQSRAKRTSAGDVSSDKASRHPRHRETDDVDVDEEDAMGRSALGRSKRHKLEREQRVGSTEGDGKNDERTTPDANTKAALKDERVQPDPWTASRSTTRTKRAGAFLDDFMAEKARGGKRGRR